MQNVDIIREQFKYISFADAEILSVILDGSEVDLLLKDWRERRIHLRFDEVALFKSYEFGGDVYEYQILYESPEIEEAIQVIRLNHGIVSNDDHGYVHFSLMNDAPIVTVVFRSLKIEIE
jgi:hypothetical protein